VTGVLAPADLVKTSVETIPSFISSTFCDMHAERDHLVSVVFPSDANGLKAVSVALLRGGPALGVPAIVGLERGEGGLPARV